MSVTDNRPQQGGARFGGSPDLPGLSNLAALDASGADFHPLNRAADIYLAVLQVRLPFSFVMGVPVRTEKGVTNTGNRTFSATVTAFSHGTHPVRLNIVVRFS